MASAKVWPSTVKVFISYSRSAGDGPFVREILKRLKVMERDLPIEVWHDEKILGGTKWEPEIEGKLAAADLILALVSTDFLASDFIRDQELSVALRRHNAREATLIPVIVRVCDWEKTALRELQALPRGGKAIDTWPNTDEAYQNAADGIRAIVERIRGSRAVAGEAAASVESSAPEVRSFLREQTQLKVFAEAYRVEHLVDERGNARVSYSVTNLQNGGDRPIEAYIFQMHYLTGFLGSPTLSAKSRSFGCCWKPKRPRAKLRMTERVQSKCTVVGEIQFEPTVDKDPVSFAWELELAYGYAMSDFDFYQMYTQEERAFGDSGNPVPNEFFFVGVTYPMRELTLRVVLPGSIKSQPHLRVFKLGGRALQTTKKSRAGLTKVVGSPTHGTNWKMTQGQRPAVVKGEAVGEWTVTIPAPAVNTGYSLQWDLPRLSVELGSLDVQAAQIRRALARLCRDQPNSPILLAIEQVVKDIYEWFEAEYRGNKKFRFDVSFMAFDDEKKRLFIVRGRRDGSPFPSVYDDFLLPVGMGTAGSAYKLGKPVVYKAPFETQPGLDPYVSGGESEHGSLFSSPIDHPEYRSTKRATQQRRTQVIGIFNVGSQDPASKLRDLEDEERKAEASDLQERCQTAFDYILKDIAANWVV